MRYIKSEELTDLLNNDFDGKVELSGQLLLFIPSHSREEILSYRGNISLMAETEKDQYRIEFEHSVLTFRKSDAASCYKSEDRFNQLINIPVAFKDAGGLLVIKDPDRIIY